MLSFRLKFLTKYLCATKQLVWKHIFTNFLSKICQLQGGAEIFILKLSKKDLQCLPLFYSEMFSAWYAVRDNIEYNEDVNDVFKYCLFNNPNIVNDNKLLKWSHFIQAGITHIKDICYEVIPGFLPESCIVEIIQEQNSEISSKDIRKDYNKLLSSMPEKWKHIVCNNLHEKGEYVPKFFLCVEKQNFEFSLCTTKMFYKLLIQKLFQPPVSNEYWKEKLNMEETIKLENRWIVLYELHKPPDIVELDFKLFHNAIFTYEKLFKIGKTESNLCPICLTKCEDILHMFIKCEELQDFRKNFVFYHLESLLKDCKESIYNTLNVDEILMTTFPKGIGNVNNFFVNFFISVCRFSIYRKRQLFLQNNQKVELKRFCQYLLQHYIRYNYHYLCIVCNSKELFQRKFLKQNPMLKEKEGTLLFLF